MPDCPTCTKTLSSRHGVKCHHKTVHGESLKNTTMCERCGENFECWPSQEEETRQCSECFGEYGHLPDTNERIREKMEGREIEWADKISETASEEGVWMEGRTGKDCPHYGRKLTEEHKEKISQSLADHDDWGNLNWIEVEETGNKVRSSWEEEIDILLHNAGVEYEYEPGPFDVETRKYFPDFRVGDMIIEVKGKVWDEDRVFSKAEGFMSSYPEYTYMVIGERIPCDEYLPWRSRNELLSHINRGEGQS